MLQSGLNAYVVALPVQSVQQLLNGPTIICLDLHWDVKSRTSNQAVLFVLKFDPMHIVDEGEYSIETEPKYLN